MITDKNCFVCNTLQHCQLGLFQDSDFAGDLEDSISNSVRLLCIFGSRTFVPINWMSKKQTSVSHSCTESEVISLDAGLRMDGIPALVLWGLFAEVLYSSKNLPVRRDPWRDEIQKKHINTKRKKHNTRYDVVDHVTTNAKPSHFGAKLYIVEDNEAVIKMISKGRSPTIRHVSRIHRVALNWLFDRINLDAKVQIKFVDTKKTNSMTC